MQPGRTIHCTPSFRVLSEQQIREIHLATLEVLERTGVEVYHSEARQMLRQAGCRLEGRRVRFPSSLVEACIASAPSRVVICNREGKRCLFLGWALKK